MFNVSKRISFSALLTRVGLSIRYGHTGMTTVRSAVYYVPVPVYYVPTLIESIQWKEQDD
jgi:hypothetical protein